MPVRVREDGHEPRLGPVPVHTLPEGRHGAVRQVQQRRADLGVHVDQLAADRIDSGGHQQTGIR